MRYWFNRIKRWFSSSDNNDPVEVPNEGDRDNEDHERPDDLGIETGVYKKGEKLSYYPKAVRYSDEMRTRGTYANRYPKGAVVHFTAGRSRKKSEGGTRAKDTNKEMGAKSIKSAIDKRAYTYFINDRDGNIHQAFPIHRWGYHAGKSSWAGVSGTVSNDLVGIECQGAGRLDLKRAGEYHAYFTNESKGDLPFLEDEVRHVDKDDLNIQKGTYHKFSIEQEKGLVELLLWLKVNNPAVFSFDLVVGHDEVAPDRKNDPGGSLSMTMPAFRDYLKKEYKKRYG